MPINLLPAKPNQAVFFGNAKDKLQKHLDELKVRKPDADAFKQLLKKVFFQVSEMRVGVAQNANSKEWRIIVQVMSPKNKKIVDKGLPMVLTMGKGNVSEKNGQLFYKGQKGTYRIQVVDGSGAHR